MESCCTNIYYNSFHHYNEMPMFYWDALFLFSEARICIDWNFLNDISNSIFRDSLIDVHVYIYHKLFPLFEAHFLIQFDGSLTTSHICYKREKIISTIDMLRKNIDIAFALCIATTLFCFTSKFEGNVVDKWIYGHSSTLLFFCI